MGFTIDTPTVDYIAKVKGVTYNYVIVKDLWRGDDKPTYWVIRKNPKTGQSINAVVYYNLHNAFLFVSRCVAGYES